MEMKCIDAAMIGGLKVSQTSLLFYATLEIDSLP